MAPDDGGDSSGDSPTSEPPDAPPLHSRGIDPSVDTVWLGHRRPRPPMGRPRVSTVLLLVAFVTLLALYVALRPGG